MKKLTKSLSIKKSTLKGDIFTPASKSHTIRALTIAGLACGESVIMNPLESTDTSSCINGIKTMGAKIKFIGNAPTEWHIKGFSKNPKSPNQKINIGNSGTTLRFLTAVASLSDQKIYLDGDFSIRQRPMMPLLSALNNLGVKTESNNGKCPISVQGPIKGGKTTINGISSQFLSALLIASPLASNDTEIIVENLHEKPYVEMTLDWLKKGSVLFKNNGLDHFWIKGSQSYQSFQTSIPGDFSSATFVLCAAAITRSEILIKGLDFSDSQGDKEIFRLLKKMGVQLNHTDQGVWVKGNTLTGMELDLNNTPDALPALAVVGCFAKGQTHIVNVAHARIKECDRIKAITTELKKMGANIRETADGLIINNSRLKGTHVKGYHDHRMVMALTVAGLAIEGETVIDNAGSIKITYPTFIKDMKDLGAKIDFIQK